MNSLWHLDLEPPAFPALEGDREVDCAVIGGGLCGILTAWYLTRRGVDTLVLEADRVGSGQTGRTTAKITAQHGPIYRRLIRQFGRERASEYAHANLRAVDHYRTLMEEEHISCHFTPCSTYLYTRRDPAVLRAETEAAAWLDLPVRFTTDTELPFPVAGASVMEGQARFHPLEFLYALAKKLPIREHTPVLRAEEDALVTTRGRVKAKYVVFACHFPFPNFPGFYFLRLHQDRSYVLALRGAGELEHCYLDVDPNGLSLRSQGDVLLLGGGGHRTGQGDGDSYAALRRAARRLYPSGQPLCRWSAQDCMSLDGVPYIGAFSPSRPNWYVATGFGKWGMTGSMVAARIIAGDVTGNPDPDRAVFSPRRCKPIASAKEFGGNVAVTAAGLSKSILPRKRREGVPYPVPPRCPHLGCQLRWNREEKTWECPCHGSRFDREGRLLDGPAQRDLPRDT